MSEPVYHHLLVKGAPVGFVGYDEVAVAQSKSRAAQSESRAQDATAATLQAVNRLNRCWDISCSGNQLEFTTPWEPQLILVLNVSRSFPDCQFVLRFDGSVGTALEDMTTFHIKNGVITNCWVRIPPSDEPVETFANRCVRSVLEYCLKYVDAPIVTISSESMESMKFKDFNFVAKKEETPGDIEVKAALNLPSETRSEILAKATANMVVSPIVNHESFVYNNQPPAELLEKE